MTAIDDRTATVLDAANVRIDAAIDALLALRNLAVELPDIADRIIIGEHGSTRLHVFVGHSGYTPGPVPDVAEIAARVARVAEAAERHGAVLTAHADHKYGGVQAQFGPFELYIYAPVEQVGTAETRAVTEWQLDPCLTALGTEAEK